VWLEHFVFFRLFTTRQNCRAFLFTAFSILYMRSAVEVSWLAENIRHSSASVQLRLVAFRCL